MEEKNAILKKLGFSEEFIKMVEEDSFDSPSYHVIGDSTSAPQPLDVSPNDSNSIIIEKTPKPLSMVYNSPSST